MTLTESLPKPTMKLKFVLAGIECIVNAEILECKGLLEVENLQTNGDVYIGKGQGNGGSIEMYNGNNPYKTIITSGAVNQDELVHIPALVVTPENPE